MKITIDTKEDHPDEIKRVVSFLQKHLEEKGENVYSNEPEFTNIFAEEKPEPQQDTPQENTGFVNIFADDFGKQESSQETSVPQETSTQESTDVLGNFFNEDIPTEETTETTEEEKEEEKPRFSLFDLETY